MAIVYNFTVLTVTIHVIRVQTITVILLRPPPPSLPPPPPKKKKKKEEEKFEFPLINQHETLQVGM